MFLYCVMITRCCPQILSELPSNIAQQISQQIVRDRLTAAVFLFRDLRKGVLNALCENLESLIYSPQDVVVARRSRVLGVYVISEGEMIMVRVTPVTNAASGAALAPSSTSAATEAEVAKEAAAEDDDDAAAETSTSVSVSAVQVGGTSARAQRERPRARMLVFGVESALAESQLPQADFSGRRSQSFRAPSSRVSGGSRTSAGNDRARSGTAAMIRRSFTGGVVGQERIIRSNQAYGIAALSKSFEAQHELTARSFVEVFYVSGTVFRHTCRMHMNRIEINALFKTNSVQGELEMNMVDSNGTELAEPTAPNDKEAKSKEHTGGKQKCVSILSTLKGSVAADSAAANNSPSAAEAEQHQNEASSGTAVGPRKSDGGSSAPILRRRKSSSFCDKLMAQLEPDSTARMVFEALLFFCLVFYTVSVPLLIAGTVRIEDFTGPYMELLLVSYICDFLFLVDLLLRISVFSFKHDGVIYTELTNIMQHFLLTEPLALEFLANFPIDLLLGLFVSWELLPIARLLKMLHLRWFQAYLTSVEDLIGLFGGISLSFEFIRFVTLYICLFLLCHWVACFWLLAADISVKHFGADSNWKFWDQNTFTNYDPLTQTDDINVALFDNNKWGGYIPYVRALYFAGSAMSLGLGDVVPKNNVERLFACVIMFFGYVLFNTILGGIASLIGGFNREKREFDSETDRMRSLLKFTNINSDLTSKIMLYYDYLWSRYGGVNEMEVLASLPKSLRSSVVNQRLGPLIAQIPFFSTISESMQQMLVSLLQRRVFLDRDCIIQYGETGKELFVIEKGVVIVTSADKKVLYATLRDGDYMGESCLLEVSKRMSSAFAQGYVGTYYLTTNDFLKVFCAKPILLCLWSYYH